MPLARTFALAHTLPKIKDVETLTHAIDIGRDRLAAFPTDTLSVLSEHSSIFYDLMVDDLVQLLFGKGVFAQLQPYFRYMHFTTEHMSDMVPAGTQPRKVCGCGWGVLI